MSPEEPRVTDMPPTPADRVPRRFWIGLVSLIVYVLFAAVLGITVGALGPAGDVTAEFALSHFIPLPIAIGLLLLFVRWSGWWNDVWRGRSTLQGQPRRRWLIAIPVLMIALPLTQLPSVPWVERGLGTVLIVLVGTIMVGLGEELVCRGVLFVAVRARHGELVTLLTTSLLFAAAHIVGSVWVGIEPAAIAFQVSVLAMNGSLYYWVRRVTGRLWVAVAIHALTDFALYLSSGEADAPDALSRPDDTPNPVLVTIQVLLVGLAIAGVISAAREDHRVRTARRVSATTDAPRRPPRETA